VLTEIVVPIRKDNITPSLNRIVKDMKQVPKRAYRFFKKITPIDTGNARRRTKLKGTTIHGAYHYASYLDNGHSKQAPRGMIQPTREYLNRIIKTIMRKR
jgi:hypothetical protein